ncbi:hypothetical protein OH76DRAFT_1402244 [Lentinus brumalis]|uniref:Uncharacterized protein n=1 Tax=Lentinus brumalis TaxID=2498619 RepID=A0A371DDL0_9APHY|nr:hypothetical protein OH76DRAFT_1402244 [Polyporus brumalis]
MPQPLVWDTADTRDGGVRPEPTPSRNSKKRPSASGGRGEDEEGEVEERPAGKKPKKKDMTDKGETKAKSKATEAKSKAKGKPRNGKGSRSGPVNRRSGGTSDAEVEKLSDAMKRDAEPRLSKAQMKKLQDLVDENSEGSGSDGDEDGEGQQSDPEGEDADVGEFDDSKWGLDAREKEVAVEYLAAPERYASIRTKLGEYCITMSQVLFRGRATAEQIRNFWNNNAFKKYKAIRAQLTHTGGGDPDAARIDSDKSKSHERPGKRSDVTFTPTRVFSAAVLLSFYESKMYDTIDAVAWSDSAVERTSRYNSSDPVSHANKQGKKSDGAVGGDTESGHTRS